MRYLKQININFCPFILDFALALKTSCMYLEIEGYNMI